IYNALGQLIKIIDDCEKEAGFYICQWDGKNESDQEIENGVYFCQIKSQACNVSKKIVLLR
ncbi:MAG: FlgD immunoglobulin-like domain containing protein, partial [candidate division WOR-3 bacterium]|nr:FlgD immunoglobulin-like domain containing protein [candidate division WOR-3 bacterium]